MKHVLFLLVFVSSAAVYPAFAAEPDAVVSRRALGCSQLETLQRIRTLDQSLQAVERGKGQTLMFRAMSKGECIQLEAWAEVFRERYGEADICVRPAGRAKCVWTDVSIIRVRSTSSPLLQEAAKIESAGPAIRPSISTDRPKERNVIRPIVAPGLRAPGS